MFLKNPNEWETLKAFPGNLYLDGFLYLKNGPKIPKLLAISKKKKRFLAKIW